MDKVFSSTDERSIQFRRGYESSENIQVQSFINNISFPKSLDELWWYINEHGCYNVEDILYENITTWTAPKWSKIGDIVFFMHDKTAKSTITRLRTQLQNLKDNNSISKAKYDLLYNWINRGLQLYNLYGGRIFAIGKVLGSPEFISDDNELYEDASFYHWSSRVYSDMELYVLDNPIDISEFNDFIQVSRQSGITPVFGKEFDKLKKLIISKNDVPQYFKNSKSTPLPLTKINTKNWLNITSEYRRCFMLESQFRSYYVDYLLSAIGDIKTIFKECRCVKSNNPVSFVDNVIFINGRYLPVEIKLSVNAESNIVGQVLKYCNTDRIIIDTKRNRQINPDKLYNDNVLIVDTEDVYMFKAKLYTKGQNQLSKADKIFDLNRLNTEEDISVLKQIIIDNLL